LAERLYEAMFLVDAAKGGGNLEEVVRHIARLFANSEARIERIEKWAERKLSYPVKRVDKGIYILVYFYGSTDRIQPLRRQISLSEEILRVLITRPETMAEVRGELLDPEGQPIPVPEAAEEAPTATDAETEAQQQ